jgi:type IV pilus assembly protein PilC
MALPMPTFRCKYASPDGRFLKQTMSADSKSALRWELEKEGHFVYTIHSEERFRLGSFFKPTFKRYRRRDFFSFNQEFLVLVKTGIPIVAALDAIIEKAGKSDFIDIIQQVRYDVSTGDALSDACAKHPHAFSNLYVASIKAGERSGNIPLAVTRYIDYLKKTAALRKKLYTASTYPLILILASTGVLTLLMTYVVPSFTQTYLETGTELPALTTLLIATANGLKNHMVMILVLLVILAAAFAYARTYEIVLYTIHRMKLRVPVLGSLFLNYAAAQFARTASVVLEGGTTLIDAVTISANVVNNRFVEARLRTVTRHLEEGASFSEALEDAQVFPALATRMIAAGESGGELEMVLNEIADFYDSDVENRLAMISSAVEPTLMLVMGLVIGVIVVAMYLPIFQLAGTVF